MTVHVPADLLAYDHIETLLFSLLVLFRRLAILIKVGHVADKEHVEARLVLS